MSWFLGLLAGAVIFGNRPRRKSPTKADLRRWAKEDRRADRRARLERIKWGRYPYEDHPKLFQKLIGCETRKQAREKRKIKRNPRKRKRRSS